MLLLNILSKGSYPSLFNFTLEGKYSGGGFNPSKTSFMNSFLVISSLKA